jgi:hypothetical protein
MMDAVKSVLDGVRGAEPAPGEVRAAADRIAALGDGALPTLFQALEEDDEAVLAVAAAALRRFPGPALAEPLMGALRSARLGEMAKALVLGILEDAGLDVSDPSLVGSVVDLEGALADGFGGARRAQGGNGSHAPSAPGESP